MKGKAQSCENWKNWKNEAFNFGLGNASAILVLMAYAPKERKRLLC